MSFCVSSLVKPGSGARAESCSVPGIRGILFKRTAALS